MAPDRVCQRIRAFAPRARPGHRGARADAPPQFRELVADNVRGFLNDLSTRRRTTTMFANPQSVFAGVQESFVNTSTGC